MKKTRIKKVVGYILSLAMTMAVFPSAYVNAESTTVNAAAGRTVDVYTSGAVTKSIATWTDGHLSNGGDDAVKLEVDKIDAPVYGVMDMGGAVKVESLQLRSTGTYQHAFGLEIWGTNDISDIANTDISSFAKRLAVVQNDGVTVDSWYLQYDISVSDEIPYRYIVFRNPTASEKVVQGDYWEALKWVHEVWVNVPATVEDVAAGRTVDVYTSGAVSKTIETWTDGHLSNGGDDAVKLAVDATDAPVYGVMDLGVSMAIKSLCIRSSGTYQHAYGLEVWGTNDISDIANTDISAFATKLAVVENNGTTVDSWYLQYDMTVTDEKPYQYIIFRNPTFDERSVGTDYWAAAKWVHEVYVNAAVVDYYSTARVSGISHNTPNAVTNVGTTELVEVAFSVDIDVEYLENADVYAVDADGNKTKVNPISMGSDKFGIYPGELKPQTTYTVEVSGVIGEDGYPVPAYTSTETFTTADNLAPAAYVAGMPLVNAAEGKTVTVYNSANGETSDTLTGLTDGARTADITGAENAVPGTGSYTVLDLGKETSVASLVMSTTATDWHTNGLCIYGASDISSIISGNGIANATLLKTLSYADTYTINTWYKQYHYKMNGDAYRYIIFDGPSKESTSYFGEIYVYEHEAEEEVPAISIDVVNMGGYAGKAWDIVISEFDGAKTYTATFTDGDETKSGVIGFENVEATGGSIAFAIFLHTSRASVALDIIGK